MKIFDVYPINKINLVKANDMTLWDSEQNQYMDMYGGHAVISIGHTAPRYVEYINKQLNEIGFYSNSVIIDQQNQLAAKLAVISKKEDYSLFMCNSGAEANENALKLASFHNGKKTIISFKGGFHGRTSLAVSATDIPSIIAPVNQTENIVFVEYNNIEHLTQVFAENDVTAVIVEAIQGVGGIMVATTEFIEAIRSLCDANNAVMISDCVQCGCGRSGKYFAMDHTGVDADIYSMAKGIGNGFPVGAIMISPKFTAKHGMLGTTFGGNHLACAAALAVVDDMQDKNLIENAQIMGDYLISELNKINSPKILEIRGKGLMIGIVMDENSQPYRARLLSEEKIFVGSASDNRIIRLLPSLTITKESCDKFINSFKNILK